MSIWGSVILVQMMMSLLLMNTYIPDRLRFILIKMRAVGFDFAWLGSPSWGDLEDVWLPNLLNLNYQQPNYGLKELEFSSASFFYNYY
jgi:hypothetical protein